jgi:excisionase family DNA binding protein
VSVPSRLLTIPEVAERLAVSERFVRRLLFDGRLPKVKVGGRLVRIDERDLEAFIEAGREGTCSATRTETAWNRTKPLSAAAIPAPHSRHHVKTDSSRRWP